LGFLEQNFFEKFLIPHPGTHLFLYAIPLLGDRC